MQEGDRRVRFDCRGDFRLESGLSRTYPKSDLFSMRITERIGGYKPRQPFVLGHLNPAYIGLSYFQSGLPTARHVGNTVRIGSLEGCFHFFFSFFFSSFPIVLFLSCYFLVPDDTDDDNKADCLRNSGG